jgi:hypothetical protein
MVQQAVSVRRLASLLKQRCRKAIKLRWLSAEALSGLN